MLPTRVALKGRGAHVQPANRFLAVRRVDDFEQVAVDEDFLAEIDRPPTEYLVDDSQSIVAENDSPDIGFRYSVNPYRGWRMDAAIVMRGPIMNTLASVQGSILKRRCW